MRLFISHWIIFFRTKIWTHLQMTYKGYIDGNKQCFVCTGQEGEHGWCLPKVTLMLSRSLFAKFFFSMFGPNMWSIPKLKGSADHMRCRGKPLGKEGIWCNAFKYKANGCEDQTLKISIYYFILNQLWMSQKWNPSHRSHNTYCANNVLQIHMTLSPKNQLQNQRYKKLSWYVT